MPGYYPQLSVAFIDDQGFRQILANEDINVYNVTASSAEADFTTDAEGIIVEGSVGDVGDVIELSHDTYPLTMRLTLQATQLEAYTAVENDITTFIVENFFADTEDATSADIYILDPNENDAPLLIGSVKAGTTGLIPYQSSISKTMRVFGVAKGEDFLKTENAFKDDHGVDVFIPAPRQTVQSLFDHFNTRTTDKLTLDDMYTDIIEENTFFNDGDKLHIRSHGYVANNINVKEISYYFDSNVIIAVSTSLADLPWELNIDLIRVDDSTLRYGAEFTMAGETTISTGEITGLSLDTNYYPAILRFLTATAMGDATAIMQHTIFYPAAPTETTYLAGAGTILGGGGAYLTP